MKKGGLLTKNDIPWRKSGLYYHTLRHFFEGTFGFSVRKVTLDARFSCPNMDGTVGYGGCIFCDNMSFSPGRRLSFLSQRKNPPESQIDHYDFQYSLSSIREQMQTAIAHFQKRDSAAKYIAYFQPGTNTYAHVDQLERLYRAAISEPEVVGLAIGTRADALPEDVLDLLTDLSQETWLLLELGLQSVHDKTLRFLNRGHDYQTFLETYQRLQTRKIKTGLHLILDIPGETNDDLSATAHEVSRLKPHSVKLHNLYVPKRTQLAEMYLSGQIQLPTAEKYAGCVIDFLERLSPEIVIDRVVADGFSSHTIAPSWYRNKNLVFNLIDAEFKRRNSFQGKHWQE